MKKIIIVFAAIFILFASCKKQTNEQQSNTAEPLKAVTNNVTTTVTPNPTVTATPNICGQAHIIRFLAGQTIQAGVISISNDQTNIYLSYITTDGWQIQKTHVYVGACEGVPSSLVGNPQIGLFPYQSNHIPRVTAYTYTIPLSGLADCYCIAAHAEVVRVDANGNIVQTETGWGQGNPFGGNSWAMVINYCTQICTSCQINIGDYRTQTQGGWGANPQGNNSGSYVQSNFASAFPNGMMIGCASGYNITLTSAQAVTNFLPEGGSPSVLPKSYINPITVNNVFAGQIAALTLSIMFDAYDLTYCNSAGALSTLVVKTGTFQGWTVGQVLAESNKVLGGCFSVYTPNQLNEVLTNINENFDNGNTDNGFLICN